MSSMSQWDILRAQLKTFCAQQYGHCSGSIRWMRWCIIHEILLSVARPYAYILKVPYLRIWTSSHPCDRIHVFVWLDGSWMWQWDIIIVNGDTKNNLRLFGAYCQLRCRPTLYMSQSGIWRSLFQWCETRRLQTRFRMTCYDESITFTQCIASASHLYGLDGKAIRTARIYQKLAPTHLLHKCHTLMYV